MTLTTQILARRGMPPIPNYRAYVHAYVLARNVLARNSYTHGRALPAACVCVSRSVAKELFHTTVTDATDTIQRPLAHCGVC